jgi:hypothetical protein
VQTLLSIFLYSAAPENHEYTDYFFTNTDSLFYITTSVGVYLPSPAFFKGADTVRNGVKMPPFLEKVNAKNINNCPQNSICQIISLYIINIKYISQMIKKAIIFRYLIAFLLLYILIWRRRPVPV